MFQIFSNIKTWIWIDSVAFIEATLRYCESFAYEFIVRYSRLITVARERAFRRWRPNVRRHRVRARSQRTVSVAVTTVGKQSRTMLIIPVA